MHSIPTSSPSPGPHTTSTAAHRWLEIIVSGGSPRTFRLRGELDCVTAPTLREALAGCSRPTGEVVVVDLGEVTFLSAAAIGVLLEVHRRIAADGGRLVLSNPTRMQRRIFAILAADQVLVIEDAGVARPGGVDERSPA